MFPPLSNESIREAVRLWRHDQAQATEKYNHINKWNTSQVTDMTYCIMTTSLIEYVLCCVKHHYSTMK